MHETSGAPKGPLPALRGFGDIHRYWDSRDRRFVAPVLPGDFYVTEHDEVITTVLGSCVSTCIRDSVSGIAGLNHFMLPGEGGRIAPSDALRYGCYAVERLVNEIVKYGARREDLEVKVFGGGRVIKGMSDVGERNLAFVTEYFSTEGLPILAQDTGGPWARRVRYYAQSGRVLVQRLSTQAVRDVVDSEAELGRRLSLTPPRGQVDLFE